MCIVCCHEFKGWCKAFTRTERVLTIIECILLVLFIGFLSFLILHLIVCPQNETSHRFEVATTKKVKFEHHVTKSLSRHTVAPGIKCTWKPSEKTKSPMRYYEYGLPPVPTTTKMEKPGATDMISTDIAPIVANDDASDDEISSVHIHMQDTEDKAGVEASDGEEPEIGYDKFVIALVKIKPMRDITFGCILTIVSQHWTLTAASCIESIEEVDSLDSFVMLEGYGGRGAGAGRAHSVGDVRLHPLYAGDNRSYDLAALRSDGRLAPGPGGFLQLPSMLDYLLTTIGERLSILGYGRFRTIESSATGRSVRTVHVYRLPLHACAGDSAPEAWELRHLARPEPLAQGACAAVDICAGPLHSRGLPCNYCSGTPLLVGRQLLGIMADNPQCGVSCEPVRYVNLAALRDWIEAVLSDQIF